MNQLASAPLASANRGSSFTMMMNLTCSCPVCCEPFQLLARVFGVEPVRNVASRRQSRQFEDADARRESGEIRRYSKTMVASSVIVVGYDDHVTTVEKWIKFGPPLRSPRLPVVPPLSRSTSIAGGDELKNGEIVGVPLALDDEDAGVERSGDQFRQAIGNLPRALNLPNPPAVTIGSTLTKI